MTCEIFHISHPLVVLFALCSLFTARIGDAELTQIVNLIPFEKHEQLCTILGVSSLVSAFPSLRVVHLVSSLKVWQVAELSHSRWELARALLKIGCYKAALKLDAKCAFHS